LRIFDSTSSLHGPVTVVVMQQSNVSDAPINADVTEQLVALLAEHPLYHQAMSEAYCQPAALILLSPADVERTSMDKKTQNTLFRHARKPSRMFRVLSVLTSDAPFRDLQGGGNQYFFFFHPEKDQLLHTNVGTWRA